MTYKQQILEKLGLSKAEIDVYLTGLSSGPSLASRLSQKTKINRTLIYPLLESLEQKGLLRKTGTAYGRRFTMERPNQLKLILKRKQEELLKLEDQIDQITTEMETSLMPTAKPAKISFYESEEGLRNILEDALKVKGKQTNTFLPTENMPKIFKKEFISNWIKKAEKLGIKRRAVCSAQPYEDFFVKGKLREMRILPQENSSVQSMITTYDNKVAVFSPTEKPFAFVVENEEFANTINAAFETIWTISKPGNVKKINTKK